MQVQLIIREQEPVGPLQKKDLQTAINSASSGDAVWVKAGTYLPTRDPFGSTAPANNRDKTFTLKNGVKVYGGFAGP